MKRIFELLPVDDEIRRMIIKNVDAQQMREVARKNGMKNRLPVRLTNSADRLST